MIKIEKQLLLVGLAALLFSCTNPLYRKFDKDDAEDDIRAMRIQLDSSQLELLTASIQRLQSQDSLLSSMTYFEILQDGKKWQAEQVVIEEKRKQAEDEKAAKEEAERIQRLNQVVSVSCIEKGFAESHFRDQLTFKFRIKNKSNKNFRAIKGKVAFEDQFDQFNTIYFYYDKAIAAGQEVIWNTSTDYIKFMGIHEDLKNKELKDLPFNWSPEQIILEDGTTLE